MPSNTMLVLTNQERRDNVTFLYERWVMDGSPRPHTEVPPIVEGQHSLDRIFFFELCYNVLASQPTAEAVILADWYRFLGANTIEQIWEQTFSIKEYATDPPVSRMDSKGKVIDFIRLREYDQTWKRLLPEPAEPDVTADILYAVSGGNLKTRSFHVIRDMLLVERWTDQALHRFSHVPTAKARKRTVRMGLVDLPERADTFADLKAFSRASHAVSRLAEMPPTTFNDYITHSSVIRCELCDAARMASCPVPHCRFRREHVENTWPPDQR